MKRTGSIGNAFYCCLQILHAGFVFLIKASFLLILFFSLSGFETNPKDDPKGETKDPPFVYDEIPVHMNIEGYGNFSLDVIYTNKNLLYINIEDLFKTLNIPFIIGQQGDSLGGFIDNETHPFVIDYVKKEITTGSGTVNAANGMIKEMGILFLESSLFKESFGLSMTFDYRALTIKVKSNFELPVIKI